MRKKMLENLLSDTKQKLNELLYENQQLTEKLSKAESSVSNGDTDISKRDAEIQSLKEEINRIKSDYESIITKKDAIITEYEQHNNQLTEQINELKGEKFDAQMYANDLKLRLETVTKTNDAPLTETPPVQPPPKIEKIESVREREPQLFDYATTAISKAIAASAEIKGKLETSGDKNTVELIALLTGKTEMFKSDVLQYMLEEGETEEKQKRMDTALTETLDYFGSILGQLEN